ncbi:MAG: O-antigen ligase family protein [Parcubacteria group bacterium]|nr:O-antigen ligase family protein [Parcubacteria group bacterium]
MKILRDKILIFIIILLAWLSFVPETLQRRYLTIVRYSLLFLLLISLCSYKFRLREYFFSKEDIFIWVYFALVSVGLINAVDKNMAVAYYRDLIILGGSVYFLIRHNLNRENCKTILRTLVVFSFIVAFIGIAEMIFAKNIIYNFVDNEYYIKSLRENRIMSTLQNPAILGHYLLVCTPLSYYFYCIEQSIVKKRLHLIMAIIITIALILTFSRGAIFGGVIVILAYLWIKNKKKWMFIVFLAFIVFSLLVLLLPYNNSLRYRFGITYLVEYLFHSHRTTQYFVTFNMLKDHPFIGIGLHHYRLLFDQYSNIRLPYILMIPESSYLMHLAETGILGFSAFIVLLLTLLRRSFAFLKSEFNSEGRRFFLFIFLGFIGLLFNMGTYDAFLWHTPFYLFWMFAGILSLFTNKGQNEIIR